MIRKFKSIKMTVSGVMMMKVTYRMIDKQLRLRGYMIDAVMSKSSEEKFIKFMHTVKKLTKGLKGKKADGMQTSEEWLTREDGTKLRICIYKPLHLKKAVPGVLWLHGGGYALGVPELYTARYRSLIEARNCVIVAPDYRLSIDAPYPAALDDSYAALLWMKKNAEKIGIRSDQLMVGGESAGGGLTAALTLYARDKNEVNIAFQMPLYPMMDDRSETESAKENNAPIWNARTNRWGWKLYLGDLYGGNVPPYAAAARATDYSNLPPTVTFVGDLEPFRDETVQYIQNLKEAGVPVDFEMYKGCYHGFDIANPAADVSKKAIPFFIRSFEHAVDHYFVEQK
ncbi:alpha/beta hydrolase [Jeotgalibaca sp. A127]